MPVRARNTCPRSRLTASKWLAHLLFKARFCRLETGVDDDGIADAHADALRVQLNNPVLKNGHRLDWHKAAIALVLAEIQKWPHKFRQRVEGGNTELNEAGIG